ncbi:acetate kinase [Candidatus Poribacteria bacterium]|nr:acetate kinase [Candidatus Poribacteria bacterium]
MGLPMPGPACHPHASNSSSSRRHRRSPRDVDILAINAGSSSLKFSAFTSAAEDARATGLIDWGGAQGRATCRVSVDGDERVSDIEAEDHLAATRVAVETLSERGALSLTDEIAVGHRVVHGGTALRDSTLIDEQATRRIAELSSVAPLHNPPALRAIEAARVLLPGAPHVAVFDTAFYRDLPRHRYIYPLPYAWYEEWGVRRFGFHGISHEYCAARAAEMLGRDPAGLNVITCHLGAGCSATATAGGVAAATSMGFTPLAGPMMGTRSGTVDPGILLHVQRVHGLDVEDLDRALNRESGLLAVSGVSSDYRAVEAAGDAGDDRARLALDMYAEGVRAAIGGLATTLPRLDALAFTAGIGENSAALRASVCDGLGTLGVSIDAARNRETQPDADIAATDSYARVLIIRAREDLMIARETRNVLARVGP